MSNPPRMNDLVRADAANSVLCWLATVDEAGVPGVTPKEFFDIHDDTHLVIADIASANSVRNIRARPDVCVSFIDVFRQRGFKITGQAAVFGPDRAEYRRYGSRLLELAGDDFPIRHIIVVTVSRIGRILAPSYRLDPDRGEEDRMVSTYKLYGVRPA